MRSPAKEKRNDMIDAFNLTSKYLDDLLNIDNIHVAQMVYRKYPAELPLTKLILLIPFSNNETVPTKYMMIIYDFDLVNLPFLDGDIPRRPSYGIYISHLFALQERLRMLVTSIVAANS